MAGISDASFIPTLGTMILGLAAGRWLIADSPRIPMKRFLIAGAICIAAGLALHFGGVCPIVKRIWTPAWTLFSGGLCFLFLAGFSWVVDVRGHRKWAFPLIVIGMNSMAAYLMAHLFESFLADSFRIHLGRFMEPLFGAKVEALLFGVMILISYWLMLFWMYRRKIFLRV